MESVRTSLPLGQGYFPIDSSRPPDLEASLEQLGAEAAAYLQTLPPSPVCLMDGIVSPEDAQALRLFLNSHGVSAARLRAVDSLGMIEPDSVDVLVQDSLLNRAPHCLHEAIMAETARVLRPGGLGMVNFTDHQGLGGRFRLRHPRPGARVYGLRDLPPVLREGLFQEAVLLEADPAKLTLVTAPNGNFEFYFPCQYVTKLFERHGLDVLIHRQDRGRHVTLIRKRG